MVKEQSMFEALFGNQTVEKVLLFLWRHQEGYARGMAERFALPVNAIQQQLRRLEEGNVVVSRQLGRTRLYQLNPRYPLRRELEGLLEKAFSFVPSVLVQKHFTARTRPRRLGKP
jgi:DNA-binding transcriptional ArsR family regulator